LRHLHQDLLERNSQMVLQPESNGKGSWVGAPAAYFDHDTGLWLLMVRYRNEPKRGYKSVLYETKDGVTLKERSVYTAEELNVRSIERGAITRENNNWKLFLSWEEIDNGCWHIATAESNKIEDISYEDFTVSCDSKKAWFQWCKDPTLFKGHMFIHTLSKDEGKSTHLIQGQSCVNAIARRCVWDQYCQRITSIIQGSSGFIGFYDGAPRREYNQEEKSGLLVGDSLTDFRPLLVERPVFYTDEGSGSIRYIEAREHEEDLWIWFEKCTPDWSHELCFVRIGRKIFLQAIEDLLGQ